MRFLSLFSGIEAASVAFEPIGGVPVAFSEIEPFPCAVLAHHYPNVPNLGDVTKITEGQIASLGPIDLVCFGSPCQDLSVAGKRKGLVDAATGDVTRSGLFFAAMRIFKWANKHCGARFALWENVAGAYSSNKGEDFAAVVAEMAGLENVRTPENGWGSEGCAVGDNGMLEWACMDAQWFGVAQRRRRVFAVLDTGDWANRPPLLLEPDSLRRDSPPSREAGESVAGTFKACASSGGWRNSADHAAAGYMQPVAFGGNNTSCPIDVATARNACASASASGRMDFESETFLVQPAVCVTGQITHTLKAEGFDASEDGTGRGQPIICCHGTQDPCVSEHTAFALGRNNGGENAIAFAQNSRDEVRLMNGDCQIVGALAAEPGMKQTCYVAQQAVGLDQELNGRIELAGTLQRKGDGGFEGTVMTPAMQVRRLTPQECELLQGFPPFYTLIPWRKKPAEECPDGPRYKALGNSWAVPNVRWIGARIQAEISK